MFVNIDLISLRVNTGWLAEAKTGKKPLASLVSVVSVLALDRLWISLSIHENSIFLIIDFKA